MKVPRPGPEHWSLLHRGFRVERPPLPAADANGPATAALKSRRRRVKSGSTAQPIRRDTTPTAPRIDVPELLKDAHFLVRQTYKALTGKGTRLDKGFVEPDFGRDCPLSVHASPGQVNRALRILDAIVKSVVARGGHFERGPEPWRLMLFVWKQPVAFRMTEAMKRRARVFTDEERTAKDFWTREKI